MPHCHICHAEVAVGDSIHLSSTQLHHVVRNGFNPFTENIRFGLGLTLRELGFTDPQETGIIYDNWKLQALFSHTDWLLCATCYSVMKPYIRKWWHLRTSKTPGHPRVNREWNGRLQFYKEEPTNATNNSVCTQRQ